MVAKEKNETGGKKLSVKENMCVFYEVGSWVEDEWGQVIKFSFAFLPRTVHILNVE